MKRRSFIKANTGIAAALTASAGCAGKREDTSSGKEIPGLAGMPLDVLRARYRADLFDEFLPFMERHVIDHRYGGFMCSTRPDGTNLSTTKRAGYEGRGVWVYSFLYNNLASEQKYLDVAERSVRLLLKNKPVGASMWPGSFTREGEPSSQPGASVNADLYIADGLAEFARATGDDTWWNMAREILMKCLWVYDQDDYGTGMGKGYVSADTPPISGIRIMDDWMLFLWVATQMLHQKPDADLVLLAAQCTDTIMTKFYNPETGLTGEILNHDYTRPKNDYAQVVNFGNDFQALWHVMASSLRIGGGSHFHKAAERLRRHIQVALDDVYGGVLNVLANVDKNIWRTGKAHYVQVEPLVGLLYVIEHTGADWAQELFGKIYDYEQKTFHLKQYNHPLWVNSADREGMFDLKKSNRIGNFHQPRHLMLNLLGIERMIERGGKVSGVFT
ncbi:MAG: hypothetical protein HOC71_06120 [Candidatus Latescibacteria bacterium]|jgi:N-acylglucosamine 2-epimerase|nr:hypothetical protein [Candidatus Latescibacterota bacterium]